jgi:pimeloyl-ACP methyl ester carboxylesterase
MVGSGIALVGGVLVDRRVGARKLADLDDGTGVELGSLRGDAFEIKADDGVVLHAEVDELSPYASSARYDHKATVVFIHGFSLTLDCWHFQRQAFRGKRRMVFFDLRSHGRSDPSDPEHATIDQLGRDLHDVLEVLAPDEPVVLVGHSMGGMSVVALAEEHPELFGDRVVGVGLISTTAGGQRTHKIVSRFIPDAIGRRVVERGLLVAAQRDRILEVARRNGSGIALRVIEDFAFGDRPVPPTYVAFLDSMISATPLKVLFEFIPEFDALDKFHVVTAFSEVPTWILCGTKDKLTSIGHARKLHEHIANSHLEELEGAGHLPIFDYKERVNSILEQLFEAADARIAERP